MPDTQGASRNLPDWLSRLDTLQLECDGLSRVISRLLLDAGVPQRLRIGKLYDLRRPVPSDSVGQVHHFWVEVSPEPGGDPLIIDLRARMWMGEAAPHGVFTMKETGPFLYSAIDCDSQDHLPLFIISAMAGCDISKLVSLDEVRSTDWRSSC